MEPASNHMLTVDNERTRARGLRCAIELDQRARDMLAGA